MCTPTTRSVWRRSSAFDRRMSRPYRADTAGPRTQVRTRIPISRGFLERASLALKIAGSSLRASPWNTVAVVLVLACALGAYRAVGTAWSAITQPNLPYRDAADLVHVEVQGHTALSPGYEHLFYREVDVLTNEAQSFAWVGQWFPARLTLGSRGARIIRATSVDLGLFDALHAAPAEGRLFRIEDHAGIGRARGFPDLEVAGPVVVLAHGLATSIMGDVSAAVGSEIVLDGHRAQIVGVMPEGFFFPDRETEAWLPAPGHRWLEDSKSRRNAPTLGRLRAGVTPQIAGAEATALLQGALMRPEDQRVVVVPVATALTRSVRPTVAILRTGTLLLVVAAGASVAGLRLARARAEAYQAAIRHSVGASLVDESAVTLARVAVLAGSVGSIGWLVSFGIQPVMQPFAGEFVLDGGTHGRRALETLALTLLAVAIAELPSALESARSLPGRRGPHPERARGLFLLAGGAATSVVILIATATIGKSSWSLLEGSEGYSSQGLAQLTVDFRGRDVILDHAERGRVLEGLVRSIEALPTVAGAAWADKMPDAPSARFVSVIPRTEGPPLDAPSAVDASYRLRTRSVSPGFLELLGMPILNGRGLLGSDDPPAPRVALADHDAIRAAGSGNVLGELLDLGTSQPRIVGVVPAIATFPAGRVIPTIYQPFAVPPLLTPDPSAVVAVRFRESPGTDDLARLATIAGSADPSLRTLRIESVRDRRFRILGAPAYAGLVLGVFGICGILMAVAGTVGQVSDYAARASRPLAIRTALGAPPDLIVWTTVRGALAAAVVAVLAGCFAGWLLVQFIASRVVWVQSSDPLLYLGPAALLILILLVAGVACGVRGSRFAPWPRLRSD